MELGYKDKWVLVTAGSKGLGKASAMAIASEGANVIISSRSEDALHATATEIKEKTGAEVYPFAADVSDSTDIQRLFTYTKSITQRLDGLVCNAGGPPSGSLMTLTDGDWEKAFQTNLLSVVRLIRETVPLMSEGGRIVSIASSSVKMPIPGLILSNTMRTGVQGLMKTLSIELASDGILVNTVCPGRITTERVQELDELKASKEERTIEEVQEQNKKDIPLGRYGSPDEFGQLVAYLLSPANTYLTGSTYMVDGGMVKAL